MSAESGIGDRLKMARGGRTLDEVAEATGVSQATLIRYEKGRGTPDADFLISFCILYGVRAEWLLHGTEPMLHRDLPEHGTLTGTAGEGRAHLAFAGGYGRDRRAEDDFVYVPYYNVEASGGHGAFPGDEEIVDFLAFKRRWVRQELGARPEDLAVIRMTGESMEPVLRAGDILLVNRNFGSKASDGIYLIEIDSALLVKRLQFMPEGVVKISSENAAYDSFTVTRGELKVSIMGRIVWAGRKF